MLTLTFDNQHFSVIYFSINVVRRVHVGYAESGTMRNRVASVATLAIARSSGNYLRYRAKLAKFDLIIFDEMGMRKFTATEAQDGLTSRNGNLRTTAAVHNALNQAACVARTLHIESRMGDTSDSCEINRLSRLGVRDDPNLEVTPFSDTRSSGTGLADAFSPRLERWNDIAGPLTWTVRSAMHDKAYSLSSKIYSSGIGPEPAGRTPK